MKDPRHISAFLGKQRWQTAEDGYSSLSRDCFGGKVQWDDILALFRDYAREWGSALQNSIFLGEHRYWLDGEPAHAAALLREHMQARPLTGKDLSLILRKMMKVFRSRGDNFTACSSALLEQSCDFFKIYNLAGGPEYIVIDGKVYSGYVNAKGKEDDVEWELFSRFERAAARAGYLADCSNTAFRILGLPYDVGCIYRKKSSLMKRAARISGKDAVLASDGRILYHASQYVPRDGNTLMLVKIGPGADTVKIFTGETCTQLIVLVGRVRLCAHHQTLCCVSGEDEPAWHDIGDHGLYNGHGGICCEPDDPWNPSPEKSYFTMRNEGAGMATVLVSKEKKYI